jgi:tRNA-dihydrouridine synthase 1
LSIVKELKTKTSPSAVKGHLFKLMRPGLARELDLRDRLGKIKGDNSVDEYLEVVEEMKKRMDVGGSKKHRLRITADRRLLQRDMKEAEEVPVEQLIAVDPTLGVKVLPHWLAQPYWRPLPPPTRTWVMPD